MNRYALVKNGAVVDSKTLTDAEAAEFKPREINGVPMWRPYIRTADPAFDPAIEKLVDDPRVITDTDVTDSRSKVALTQQEIDDNQEANDLSALKDAGRDIAVVLVELVDQLLADNTIQVTDFSAAVKQNFQDVKAIADRVK